MSTSESISAKPNKETLNFEHFPEKLISKSAPNTQNTKKLENLVKKELETPFIVHAEINKVHTCILYLPLVFARFLYEKYFFKISFFLKFKNEKN